MNDFDDRRVSLILDTSAILAFCRGSLHVGEVLAEVGDDHTAALLPAVCLVEAHQAALDHDRLDILAAHRTTVLDAGDPAGWKAWAAMYALTGSADAAAAALAYIDHQALILSARPGLYERVGGGRMVIPADD